MIKIGSQQASATEHTVAAINQLLDHVTTYPNDEIPYRASDMILAAHSYSGFNNESKTRSREGSHIFFSENEPIPKWIGYILMIAQIIKFVMSFWSITRRAIHNGQVNGAHPPNIIRNGLETNYIPNPNRQLKSCSSSKQNHHPTQNQVHELAFTLAKMSLIGRKFRFIGPLTTSIEDTIVQSTIPPFIIPITAQIFLDMSIFSKEKKTINKEQKYLSDSRLLF